MRSNWLKTLAFALLLILVGCRCLMREILRDQMVVVGGELSPKYPMAGVRLALDGLMCLPALLVVLHRVVNPTSRIKFPGYVAVFALLAVWAIVSTGWSADRYAAMVTGIDLLAAVGALFAAIQCINTPKQTRWVAGLVVGLLVALAGNGVYKRVIEHPAVLKQWYDKESPSSRWVYMTNNNLKESDFQFKQFEIRINSGEVMGFSSSPNGYAAMIAVGLVVMFGVMGDHYFSGRKVLAGCGLAVLPLAGFVLKYTYSKQGMATPVLGLVGLFCAGWLAKRYKKAFWVGLAVFCVLTGLAVGYGRSHGGFPNASLTVRWQYAVGGWRIFQEHLLAGVGWSNFGAFYPAVRNLSATEQVQDPHNLFVRGLSELGIVGLALMLAGFAWASWDVFKPMETKPDDGVGNWMKRGVWGIVLGMGLNFVAGEDFSMGQDWLILSALGVVGMGLAMIVGMWWVLGEGEKQTTPWVRRGLAAGLAIFFVHNLLDFSWSEPGPLALAALMAGSLVGGNEKTGSEKRGLAWLGLGGMGLAWVAMWGVAVWVTVAEQKGVEADEKLRTKSVLAAAERYAQAFEWMPINADFAYKEAMSWQVGGQMLKAKGAMDKAIGANGRVAKFFVARAEIGKKLEDQSIATEDYDRAVKLDPMDLDLRLEYAKTLEWAGKMEEARREYQRVLEMDEKLVGEFRRLSDEDRKMAKEKAGA